MFVQYTNTMSASDLGYRMRAIPDLLVPLERRAWLCVALVLTAYSLAFACFYPDVVTVKDEARYVQQAQFYAAGLTSELREEPFTGEMVASWPGTYPFGTSTLMAPFVAAFGWRGVYVVPWLALVLGVFMTARWIAEERRSPLFALVIMGFPAALVMGRTAMSDVPSLAFVAAGLLCFFRGIERGALWSFASGLCAGLSLTVRESNVLVFAPFYAGALLRRDRNVGALVLGGLLGTAMRPLGSWIVFGDPFFTRGTAGFFDSEAIPFNLAKHLLALMILVPGGLLAGFLYRGRRAIEVRCSVALFVVFYVVYNYSGSPSGWLKGAILGNRFFLPLLPVLAFALAEFVPRVWRGLVERHDQAWLRPSAGVVVAIWLLGLVGVSAAVHAYSSGWSRTQAAMRDRIEEYVEVDKPLVANLNLTEKVIDRFGFKYVPIDRGTGDFDSLLGLAARHDHFFVVLVDRNESDFFSTDLRRNEELVTALEGHAELLLEERTGPNERLRILRVDSKESPADGGIASPARPGAVAFEPRMAWQPARRVPSEAVPAPRG